MPKPDETMHDWAYTQEAQREYGYTHLGRPLIGRDTDVRGGVYYGTYRGEAIVVDPEKYPGEYERYYQEAASRASPEGSIEHAEVLSAVFTTVEANMRYSKDGVDAMLKGYAKNEGLDELPDGRKVDLSTFMKHGVGVCRHQALACATLLERFKDEGHIEGDISVDRNQKWSPRQDENGGHAWARYTSLDDVYILDVAQGYLGKLEDADPASHWNYLRPEEQTTSRSGWFPRWLGDLGINS